MARFRRSERHRRDRAAVAAALEDDVPLTLVLGPDGLHLPGEEEDEDADEQPEDEAPEAHPPGDDDPEAREPRRRLAAMRARRYGDQWPDLSDLLHSPDGVWVVWLGVLLVVAPILSVVAITVGLPGHRAWVSLALVGLTAALSLPATRWFRRRYPPAPRDDD